MRELKHEDPSELVLGLELELESEDVHAAVAAVAALSEGQIPCSCCDQLLDSTEQLHSHQVEHHSLLELSLALITLRGLDFSLGNTFSEINETPEREDDSSHLRSILMGSVDRRRDCDTESTVTVSSDTRMAMISPFDGDFQHISTLVETSMKEEADFSPWRDVVTSPSYSPNSFMRCLDSNCNEVPEIASDSGFWSDTKPEIITKPSNLDRKTSSKKYSDVESRQFFCDLCDRRYKKKSHLERHQRVHTGVRPYACPMCDKRFAVRSILKQHIRVHTGERPFSCNVCFQRFPQKSGLMTHMMLHNGKPFKCEYCIKSFVSNHKLMLHQRSHGDLLHGAPQQGPYCCSSCDMRFFTTGALTEHAKLHGSQYQPSLNRKSFSNGVTISEEAAKAAVAAVSNISVPAELEDDIPGNQGEAPKYQTDSPEFQFEFLDVLKNELMEDNDEDDDSATPNDLFRCEARWSGLNDMYV